jgi:predicted hydrocarbon binding protein
MQEDTSQISGENKMGKNNTKDIPVYVYNPRKKNYHIYLRLKNSIGAIAEASQLLKKASISVLGGITSVYDGEGTWSFFAESEKTGLTASDVSSILRKAKHVIDVSVEEDSEGFLVDTTFPLRWNTGEKAVLIRHAFIVSMLDTIREKFGSVGEAIIYEEGVVLGREGFREIIKKIGQDFAKKHVDQMVRFYNAVGWGMVKIVHSNILEPRILLWVYESFECSGHSSKGTYSRFFRGHLAGAFSSLFGIEMDCTETRCISSGNDKCEFLITPRKSEPN